MKKLFLFISVLICSYSFGQSNLYYRADTSHFLKGSSPLSLTGNHEVNIYNATRSRTGAFLQNRWNGRTQFAYAIDSAWRSNDTLYARRGDQTLIITGLGSTYSAGNGLVLSSFVFRLDTTSALTRARFYNKILDSLRGSGWLDHTNVTINTYAASNGTNLRDGFITDNNTDKVTIGVDAEIVGDLLIDNGSHTATLIFGQDNVSAGDNAAVFGRNNVMVGGGSGLESSVIFGTGGTIDNASNSILFSFSSALPTVITPNTFYAAAEKLHLQIPSMGTPGDVLTLINSTTGEAEWAAGGGAGTIDSTQFLTRMRFYNKILDSLAAAGWNTSYTFTNGLTNTAGTVKLGGNLVNNTNINLEGFNFTIQGGSGSGNINLITGDGSEAYLQLYTLGQYVLQAASGEGISQNYNDAGMQLVDDDSIMFETGKLLSPEYYTASSSGSDSVWVKEAGVRGAWKLRAQSDIGGGSSAWGGITGTLSDQTDLQSALDDKSEDPSHWTIRTRIANGTATTFNSLGWGGNAVFTGTASAVAPGTTDYIDQFTRVRATSATTTSSAAGDRYGNNHFYRGGAAGRGGFEYSATFGVPDTCSSWRFFAGMSSTTGALGFSDPDQYTNIVGVGKNDDDGYWYIMHNDGSGTATRVGTNIQASQTTMYELKIYCAPNGSGFDVTFTDKGSGTSFSTTVTTNLIAATTLINPQIIMYNNTGGVDNVAVDISKQIMKTPY